MLSSRDPTPRGRRNRVTQQTVTGITTQARVCTPLDPDGGQQCEAGHGQLEEEEGEQGQDEAVLQEEVELEGRPKSAGQEGGGHRHHGL